MGRIKRERKLWRAIMRKIWDKVTVKLIIWKATLSKGTVFDNSDTRYIKGAKRVKLHDRVRTVRKHTAKKTLNEKGIA